MLMGDFAFREPAFPRQVPATVHPPEVTEGQCCVDTFSYGPPDTENVPVPTHLGRG